MDIAQLIKRVRGMAGDESAMQFSNENILDWVNEGILECAQMNNLLQRTATNATAVGTDSYTLPPDILKLHSVKIDGIKVPVLTMEEYEKRNEDTNSTEHSDATVAYVWAGTLKIWPSPKRVTPLVVEYLYHPPVLANFDVEAATPTALPLPISYHNRILDYCLAQVAQQDDDMNRYQLKMLEFQTGVQNLSDQEQYSNDLYPSISVSPDDYGYTY